MHGSQFHSQLALTTMRPSTEALKSKRYQLPSKNSKRLNILTVIGFIFLTFCVSTAVFAGPSSPRLKGGNGNANGR